MRLNPPPGVTITRCFERFTSEVRADHAASFRLGPKQRYRMGDFYYVASSIPDRAFDTRKKAVEASLAPTHPPPPQEPSRDHRAS